MADDLKDFTTRMAAGLSGLSPEEYVRLMEECVKDLGRFTPPKRLETEDDYRNAHKVKGLLCSLSCYTFNNKHPRNDEVWDLEAAWGALMARYNRRLLIKNPEAKTIARYLLWNRRYRDIAVEHFYKLLRNHGFLCRSVDGGCYVIGLVMKVGDNVFTVDDRGRHYRQYRHTVGRQAFRAWLIEDDLGKEAAKAFIATLPLLDETYYVTYIQDGKGCVRRIALRRSECHRILEMRDSLKQVA